ncbi:hypothetical protein WMF23_41280 [Sorangium sp. So ce542]
MGLAGALRVYRGVSETISSLLLNYIGIALLNHLVEGALRDPASLNKPSTAPIGADYALGNLPGVEVHGGLAFGALACVLCYALMHRTTFGFAAAMSGGNVRAALLAGLPVRRPRSRGPTRVGARAGSRRGRRNRAVRRAGARPVTIPRRIGQLPSSTGRRRLP